MWHVGPSKKTKGKKRGPKPKFAKNKLAPKSLAEIMEASVELVHGSYKEASQRVIQSARNAWQFFVELYARERPTMLVYPRGRDDEAAYTHNELSVMLFATWLHEEGYAPSTVGSYVSLVKTDLQIENGWKLTIPDSEIRLPRLLKAIRKLVTGVREKRVGWRAHHERSLFEKTGGPSTYKERTAHGMRNFARQGLARGSDFLPERAQAFSPASLPCVSEVTFKTTGVRHYMVVMMVPAKKAVNYGPKFE